MASCAPQWLHVAKLVEGGTCSGAPQLLQASDSSGMVLSFAVIIPRSDCVSRTVLHLSIRLPRRSIGEDIDGPSGSLSSVRRSIKPQTSQRAKGPPLDEP